LLLNNLFKAKNKPSFYIIVAKFDKNQLPHTIARLTFHHHSFLHQWTNNPCMYHCQSFPGLLFPGACFSGLYDMFECLCDLQMAMVWLVTGQVPTQLEIVTRLASELGFQISYYLWYLELKQTSGETIWQCLTSACGKTCHFVAPYHPQPPPLCDHLWY